MKIEVRNLKHSASLSEETYAYTAIIYVDGKPAFHASNHGHGGEDMYRPIAPFTYDDEKRVNEWLKANHQKIDNPYGEPFEPDLELVVGDLITAQLVQKRLDGMLKRKLVVLVEDKGQPALATYPAKFKPTPENIAKLKARGEKVVNGDAALREKALALV